MSGDMLAASRRDPNFRGIDTDALGALIRQVTDAADAVQAWLGAHQPPPGVSGAGYLDAADAGHWIGGQLGMLDRRRNFAISNPPPQPRTPRVPAVGGALGGGAPGGGGTGGTGGTGGSAAGTAPRAPRPARRGHLTPAGAGAHLGTYPTTGAATRAGTADARAIERAAHDHTALPPAVWRRLHADAADPDYTAALLEHLGPKGVAGLIAAAHHDKARLHEIGTALGTASHHLPMTRTWLRTLLGESARLHDRGEAAGLLGAAPLAPRARTALDAVLAPAPGAAAPQDQGTGRQGLAHVAAPPRRHPVAVGGGHEPED